MIKSIKKRLKSNAEFKVFSFAAQSNFVLNTDDTTQETTKISFKVIYLKNEPVSHPQILDKLDPLLKSMGYDLREEDKGSFYLYKKFVEIDIDEDLSSFFTKRIIANKYVVRKDKFEELKSKTIELVSAYINREYKKLKSILPNLPEVKISEMSPLLFQDQSLNIHTKWGEIHTKWGEIEFYNVVSIIN